MVQLESNTTMEETQQNDAVNHPSHYTYLKDKCGVEAINICEQFDFNMGNALKYLLRAGHKTEEGLTAQEKELQDLHKAAWYVNKEIELKTRNYGKDNN